MSNIQQIAKEAGVSVATVSRMLDPEHCHRVSERTKARVQKVIDRHHYVPNMAARALGKNRTNTIGMVTPFSSDIVCSSYFTELIAGLIEGAEDLPYDLKWIMIRQDETDLYTLDALRKRYMVDGLIFLAWRLYPKLVREIERKGRFPCVLINDYTPNVKASIVYVDNHAGIDRIFSFFQSRGYRRLAVLRGPEYISPDALNRYRLTLNNIRRYGMELQAADILSAPSFYSRDGDKVTSIWLEKRKKLPRLLFAVNDALAQGAISAIRRKGFQIPAQIAVAGYDGIRDETPAAPLTTMQQPLRTMGKTAIEFLDKLIRSRTKNPLQLSYEPVLLEGSTA